MEFEMEIQQLRGFYYSAKLGSLTKASDKLSVTQSAVSQQIKSLEEELEVQLFNRIGPKKELTPDGEIFLELLSPLIQEIDSLKVTFEDRKGTQKGQLTIAATTVIIMCILPNIVKKFITKYPHIKLTILEHRWSEIVSLAKSGEIDFGLAPIQNIPSSLNYIELELIDRVLITALDHPLAEKNTVHLSDIANYPMITYEKGLIHRGEIDKIFDQADLKTEIVMEATNAETIIRYVEIGIGVAIIPKIALFPSQIHRVKVISVNKYFGKSRYGVILRKGKYLTSWAKNFLLCLNLDLKNNFLD
jgi:DNA-binding transcriptional LysR family regulator